jgi:hypothetical protein
MPTQPVKTKTADSIAIRLTILPPTRIREIPRGAVALKGAALVGDRTTHREATRWTDRKGHEGLAGRRIVGGMRTKAHGPMRGCPSGSCRGFYGVLGQCGIHLAHPLIDLEGERVPPPTERQSYDTIIRS